MMKFFLLSLLCLLAATSLVSGEVDFLRTLQDQGDQRIDGCRVCLKPDNQGDPNCNGFKVKNNDYWAKYIELDDSDPAQKWWQVRGGMLRSRQIFVLQRLSGWIL
jgi:hypothetical protein